MSEQLTLELPEELARQARALATATNRRFEDAVVEWIEKAVAEPIVESLPNEQLLSLCDAMMETEPQEELSELLERQREKQLTDTERSRLDQVLAIAFSTPFFVAALSGPVLGEWVGARRWAAIGVGFIGILVVTRPGFGIVHPAALRATRPVHGAGLGVRGRQFARRSLLGRGDDDHRGLRRQDAENHARPRRRHGLDALEPGVGVAVVDQPGVAIDGRAR